MKFLFSMLLLTISNSVFAAHTINRGFCDSKEINEYFNKISEDIGLNSFPTDYYEDASPYIDMLTTLKIKLDSDHEKQHNKLEATHQLLYFFGGPKYFEDDLSDQENEDNE